MNTTRFQLFKGIGGHVQDVFRILSFTFVTPHSWTKYRQIKAVAKRTHAKLLIETGTFRGITTRRAAPYFDQVFTIELDPVLYEEAKHYLKPIKNVRVIQGDAAVETIKLLQSAEEGANVLLFLDGHYSGGETALGDTAEPAEQIIREIANYREIISGIIIDDFREFGIQPTFPTKHELIRVCEECFSSDQFRLSVHLDQVIIERLPDTN